MSAAARKTVAVALQDTSAETTETEGALLLGFVAVAEWMAPDGVRWLTLVDGTGAGDEAWKWQTRGYLHEALFCWPTDEDSE